MTAKSGSWFKILLFREEESRGIFDEVQNAGVVEADAQKCVKRDKDNRRQKSQLRQREHRDEKADADHAEIAQFPQPKGGLCAEIVAQIDAASALVVQTYLLTSSQIDGIINIPTFGFLLWRDFE